VRVARVVVEVEPFHLDHPFDYLVPSDAAVVAGQRVQVSFAGRSVRGLVVAVTDASELDPVRLKPLRRVLGPHVWVGPEELAVLRWAAERFGAPLADVVRHALPARVVDVERRAAVAGWFPPGRGRRPSSDPPPDAQRLDQAWTTYGASGRLLRTAVRDGAGAFLWRPVPGEDLGARLAELVQLTLSGDRDVLVLVPDSASRVAEAVLRAAGDLAVDLRGGPSPRRHYRAWLEARCGIARVVVGERAAAFVPLERLGLAVVLDEANPAHKERRSPRHHAREVVLERARRAGGVGLAVGTVPSAIAWGLLRDRRLTAVVPARAAERRARPWVRVVTQQNRPRTRLAREATAALRSAVRADAYGVVLAARRGQGRALVCRACGEWLACPVCAACLALAADGGVRCEGCGWHRPRPVPCPACRAVSWVPLAAGADRLGAELRRMVAAPVAVLEGYGQVPPPPPAVVVTTRGSVLDVPPGPVGAVVLPDLDALLARPGLDAAEDALRLACALAAWTVHGGRDPREAPVVVQTRDPDHPAVTALEAWDVGSFWRSEASLRAPLRFPPAAHAIRVEVADGHPSAEAALRAAVPEETDVLGPMRRDDRLVFLLKSADRRAVLAALRPVRDGWSRAGVEVRVDVDPVDAL
jgi:primosomal protein N' (replication factor Y) (superfamily II helicase)